jgi:ParB family transcriptional regulator, chromosome partitioning protein
MTTEIRDIHTDTQRACFVPVGKLIVHAGNVRRTDKRADVEALAASITAHGLLQNLSVVRTDDGRYAVVAGARRLAALRLLIKQGKIARDFAAPCILVEPERSAEASLAENVQRVAMNPMDEMEAFARLVDEGLSPDAVAQRFGATVRHVEQRLALGRLSPKIRAAYRKGDLTLDVARAFCLTGDHDAQERLFRQLAKPITHAPSVRNALSGGRTPVTDKLARFVGIDAYEAAGGRVVRDLFEDSVAFLEDGALLQRLAAERIEGMRAEIKAEGWSWVDAQVLHGQIDGCVGERVRPRTRPLTASETETIAHLEAEIETLDGELEANAEDDARWAARDAAEARLDALRESLQSWDAAEMAHAGAVIAIDWNGQPVITRGLIRRADVKAIRKIQSLETPEGGSEATETVDASDRAPNLSKALMRRLTAARTRAIRVELSDQPHTALALVVFMLIRRSAARRDVAGLAISSAPVGFEDDDRFERARTDATAVYADMDLAQLADEGTDKLMDLLALFVAEAIDVTHDDISPTASGTQATADALASLLDLDMRRHWEASVEFWEQAPKAYTIEALGASSATVPLSDAARRAKHAALAKMKRADLARVAQRDLEHWLPEALITPPRRGAFVVTPAGEAELEPAEAAA